MASTRLLFRASWPGYEKTAISIEFKYHPTQKVSYRIKRVLIHIFCGHVLELILTGIFDRYLNTYKILRILHEKNIVKFQRPKITSDTWFQTEKDINVRSCYNGSSNEFEDAQDQTPTQVPNHDKFLDAQTTLWWTNVHLDSCSLTIAYTLLPGDHCSLFSLSGCQSDGMLQN